MNHSNFTEKLILLKAKKGDKNAFGQIYDWYVKKIYQFVYFKVNSKETAEDISQEVFVRLIDYINEERKIESLQALLFRIARNLVIDHYRSGQVEVTSIDEMGEALEVSTDGRALLDMIDVKYSLEQIQKSLAELKEEYREVVTLRFVEDMTHREIAKIIDRKESHVRVILFRAINELRNILNNSK